MPLSAVTKSQAQSRASLKIEGVDLTNFWISIDSRLLYRSICWSYSFSIIHGSGRAWKTGKAWEHLSHEWRLVDARWTYGGRGPHSNNILDFIIERSNDSQDSWGSQDRQYSTSLVRNLLYRLLHTSWLMGNAPPTSTSRPPDVIHVIGVPRPSPFFVLFPFRVLYWTKSEEQKKGEAWERG